MINWLVVLIAFILIVLVLLIPMSWLVKIILILILVGLAVGAWMLLRNATLNNKMVL